jgi:outer membrane biosynthesis protein TonB
VQSAGTDFDQAAQKAAKLLRFTPAFLGSQRVGVKMRQAIQFKLEQ